MQFIALTTKRYITVEANSKSHAGRLIEKMRESGEWSQWILEKQILTNNKIKMEDTATLPVTIDNDMLERKKAAWGTLGAQIYEQELKLQARAQATLAKIKIPTKMSEVVEAEKTLKELKGECAAITLDRKSITGKFDDVSKRLMEPEKSFIEPLAAMEKAIIALKKADEDRQRIERQKIEAKTKCREFLMMTKNNADSAFKTKILEKVNKAYEYALGDGAVPFNELDQFIELALTRLKDTDFKIQYPNNTYQEITLEEYTKMCAEILLIDSKKYLAHYENELRLKFSDYEVALKNKVQALALAKQDSDTKAAAITSEKINADTSAKLEAMVIAPVVSETVKGLKQSYEIDMAETVESMIIIMTAFTLHMDKCLPKLNVKKWFSFTPSQAAVALSKVKCDDNEFAHPGLVFKTVDKL